MLHDMPLWGYFVILGACFLGGHLFAYRPDPAMGRGRRLAGRWGSSLLLLVGLLLVSNRHVGTVLPAVLLALLGGIVSGRSAPPPPDRRASAEGAEAPAGTDRGAAAPADDGTTSDDQAPSDTGGAAAADGGNDPGGNDPGGHPRRR